MTTAQASQLDPARMAEKQGLAIAAGGGFLFVAMGHLGVRLGLYEALAGGGPMTSSAVAQRAGLRERFVREWLYHQAASGVVEFHGGTTFELSPEAAQLFAERESPVSLVARYEGFPVLVDLLVRAESGFRSTLGGSYDDFGPEAARMVEAVFGAWNRNALVPEALPRIPGLIETLTAGARVCDLGCGGGSAPLAIGRAFPASRIDGYDNSLNALALAEESRQAAGLSNVRFLNNDLTPLPAEPTYDVVLTLDCLHDMPRPDLAAEAIRRAIKPDGVWLIADADAADTVEANLQKPTAALFFANSVAICLQSGASTPDGLALGNTGLPESAMRRLVSAAGFAHFRRIEGVPHPLNAYYEVRP